MTRSPQIAAVLNLTPNHLDRHLSMEAYALAKARILDYQKVGDCAVLSRDDPGAWGLREHVQGRLISFGRDLLRQDQPGVTLQSGWIVFWDGISVVNLLPENLVALRGEHNLDNVLAACALAVAAGLPAEAMAAAVDGFTGVEHRLEFVRQWRGASWYNDSIATAPERSIAAIRSFKQPLVLLAGGRDKDLPWSDFALWTRRRVDHLILFGEAKEIILNALGPVQPGDRPFTIHACDRLSDAIQVAVEIVEPGDVVLLSPGGTSFDEFHDFAERGAFFREWVNNLL
jgi:UDP-N-acetylmuramoylalanine--D-glutamate ligase